MQSSRQTHENKKELSTLLLKLFRLFAFQDFTSTTNNEQFCVCCNLIKYMGNMGLIQTHLTQLKKCLTVVLVYD